MSVKNIAAKTWQSNGNADERENLKLEKDSKQR